MTGLIRNGVNYGNLVKIVVNGLTFYVDSFTLTNRLGEYPHEVVSYEDVKFPKEGHFNVDTGSVYDNTLYPEEGVDVIKAAVVLSEQFNCRVVYRFSARNLVTCVPGEEMVIRPLTTFYTLDSILEHKDSLPSELF